MNATQTLLAALLLSLCCLSGCKKDANNTAAHDAGPDAADSGTVPDGAVTSCDECPSGTVCAQLFDGTCSTGGLVCIETNLDCPPDTCTEDCESLICFSPYQCDIRSACGTEIEGAFNCYGP